jgi:serine/threonine protein kinase
MGCGSSSPSATKGKGDPDDPTKGPRLSENGPSEAGKPKKKKLDRSASGNRTLDLSGTILEQPGDVRDYYTFDKVLGKGNFGVVHLVYEKKTNQPFACKSISKRKLVTPDDIGDVQREIQVGQDTTHLFKLHPCFLIPESLMPMPDSPAPRRPRQRRPDVWCL